MRSLIGTIARFTELQPDNRPLSAKLSLFDTRMRHPPRLLMSVLLIVCTLAAFGAIVGHDFTTLDDNYTIAFNPDFNPPSVASVLEYWRKPAMELYVPVTYTFWGVLSKLAYLEVADQRGVHLNAGIFFAANILVHALTGLVVFAVLRRLLKAEWPALGGAALFLLHPVQVEPVAWASGMKDLLCGLFSLLALLGYIHFAKSAHRGSQATHYTLATLAFVLATLAKPAAVVTPLLAAIIDLWILNRPWTLTARATLPWLLFAALCAVWTKHWQPTLEALAPEFWLRPLLAADALAFYLYKLVWPFDPAFDYGRSPRAVLAGTAIWFTWLVPLALGTWLWWQRRRTPFLFASGLLFVAALLPMLGFSPFLWQSHSTVSDHYLHLAMFGPAVAFAWALSRCSGGICISIAILILSLLGILSHQQTVHWSNSVTLYTQILKVNPASFLAKHNLAIEYQRQGLEALTAGNPEEARKFNSMALELFAQALALNPGNLSYRNNYASMLAALGRYDDAASLLGKITDLKPDGVTDMVYAEIVRANLMLGEIRNLQQRYPDAAKAFARAVELDPDRHEAQLKLQHARSLLRSDPGTHNAQASPAPTTEQHP